MGHVYSYTAPKFISETVDILFFIHVNSTKIYMNIGGIRMKKGIIYAL